MKVVYQEVQLEDIKAPDNKEIFIDTKEEFCVIKEKLSKGEEVTFDYEKLYVYDKNGNIIGNLIEKIE